MRLHHILAAFVIVAGFAPSGFAYFFGGVQTKLEYRSFAKHLETCAPLHQDLHDLFRTGMSVDREIYGAADGACRIRIGAYDGNDLLCSFAMGQAPRLAEAFRDQAKMIGLFGGYEMRISTSDPDPLTQLYNSPQCALDSEQA
ncbi:hypothetical protein AIOL_003529 [Candidatus Rhodobacter oscarellae]|uniref:Uncharacterized protein n=1 Tax=Candidatus Rhodobacter oscarellae TaxID=1675527 RepID=A0A0J9E764_9RHOB|nr:hypothetical protein [Candidatus Rhodobacter lobularis]KMW58552.1 hypothetical protein AIOL_003529 [Candidatus Rhodobacter lobularis]